MSFDTFVRLFDSGFDELRTKPQTLVQWHIFFREVAINRIGLSPNDTLLLPKFVTHAFNDSVEMVSPRNRYEACMLFILDLVMAKSNEWPKERVTQFRAECYKSNTESWLLYNSLKALI